MLIFYCQVDEEPEHMKKPEFIDFKRVVWHTSFEKVLLALMEYAEFGRWFTGADGVLRWLFYIILIICADYEEQ